MLLFERGRAVRLALDLGLEVRAVLGVRGPGRLEVLRHRVELDAAGRVLRLVRRRRLELLLELLPFRFPRSPFFHQSFPRLRQVGAGRAQRGHFLAELRQGLLLLGRRRRDLVPLRRAGRVFLFVFVALGF